MEFTEQLWVGIAIGIIIIEALRAATKKTYRQTLQHCADTESAEKLPDGKFYYLVREDKYNLLTAYERLFKKPVGYVSEDTLQKLAVVKESEDERVKPDMIWSPHHRPSRAIRPVFVGDPRWTHKSFEIGS